VIKAILAHDAHWGIGKNGTLPWPKNSDDLKWFKQTTLGSVVVMGRKTWDSLPNRFKRLPNRVNVVVSNQTFPHPTDGGPDHVLSGDMKSALEVLLPELYPDLHIWVIGGSQLINGMLNIIDELLLNNVDGDYDCDTFLPMNEIRELFKIEHSEIKSFGIVSRWIKK